MVKKIVAIGPESTGKSTICEALAKHYKTLWCTEYARDFLGQKGTRYDYDDLLLIAKGQVAREDEAIKATEARYGNGSGLLFIDTNMYVMKVWCEYVFGKCHSYILDQIAERKYDHYLLCNTDIPWKHDPLREYPNLAPRQELFHMYKDLLVNQAVPWTLVEGEPEARIRQSIIAVSSIFT